MIQVTPTPNYAGVRITGDFYDFDQLYESLHKIVGDEDEHSTYSNARIRILGLCYDLRHANMGHRGYEFKDHGLDEETLKWLGVVSSKKNLYLSFNTYYPEILFIVMALNDFIDLYVKKEAIHPQWDLTVQTIRKFQATVIESLSNLLPPKKFKTMLGNMSRYYVHFENYFTQYLDELNIRFLNWDKDKRLNNISIMAKRIAEKGNEYQRAREEILEVALDDNVDPNNIHYYKDYPDYENIDW